MIVEDRAASREPGTSPIAYVGLVKARRGNQPGHEKREVSDEVGSRRRRGVILRPPARIHPCGRWTREFVDRSRASPRRLRAAGFKPGPGSSRGYGVAGACRRTAGRECQRSRCQRPRP